MTTAQNVPAKPVSTAILLVLATCAGALLGCASLRPAAESIGLVPLDSARAVAVAQHNVCGDASPADRSCVLLGYRRSGGRLDILVGLRPPAGNDRALVSS